MWQLRQSLLSIPCRKSCGDGGAWQWYGVSKVQDIGEECTVTIVIKVRQNALKPWQCFQFGLPFLFIPSQPLPT